MIAPTTFLPDLSEGELRERAVALMREWYRMERGRTEVLRSLAEVIVALRSRTITDEGRPDWAGTSWEYRQAAHEAYQEAGIPSDAVATLREWTKVKPVPGLVIRHYYQDRRLVGSVVRDERAVHTLDASGSVFGPIYPRTPEGVADAAEAVMALGARS